MNFRVFASGLVLIVVYQLAIAAAAVWFIAHCEMAGGEPVRGNDAIGMTAGGAGR